MIEVRADQTLVRPAPVVFGLVSDMSRNPEWQAGMESCVWTSEPPIGVGSTYDQVARFLGREIRTSFEVTGFVDGGDAGPSHITIKSLSGPLDLDITRTVTPLDSGSCRLQAVIQGTPKGPMRLLEPLMRPKVRSSIEGDYGRLKQQLERGDERRE